MTNKPAGSTGKSNMNSSSEIEKSKRHIIVEITEYVPHSIVTKTIIKKTTGNITVSSFDTGEELSEKRLPVDMYVQIIAGTAEVIINEKKIQLKLGEGIIIPANTPHCFNANEKFKMITTVIKSSLDDETPMATAGTGL